MPHVVKINTITPLLFSKVIHSANEETEGINDVPKDAQDSICFVQYSFITIKRRKTAVNEDSSAF